MKLSILLISGISLFILGTGFVQAAPGDLACRGALLKLTRAQEEVQMKKREVREAQSSTKVAFAELEVCKLGVIINGRTNRECVKDRIDAPRTVSDLAKAEKGLQNSIDEFQLVFEQMSRVCLQSRKSY